MTTQEESFEVEQELFHQEVEAAVSTVNAASSSPALQQSDVLKLQREIELLQVQSADLKEKLSEVENERDIYWRANFQLTKLKMMSLRFYFILNSQTMEHS